MSERRLGAVPATAGAPLTLAGAAMYVLSSPRLPVPFIGLAALTTGLVMIVATRRS